MSNLEIWQNIGSGLFWEAGALSWSKQHRRYLNPAAGTNKLFTSCFDSVCMVKQDYKYKSDDEDTLHLSNFALRPSFRQCVTDYLGPEEQKFLFDAFSRAHAKMLEHCRPTCYLSAVLISGPGSFFPMHNHALKTNLTFTYVVTSGHNAPKSSVLLIDLENGGDVLNGSYDIKMDYPNQEEFFMVIDSSMHHQTTANPNDKNFYMYIIFDEVELVDTSIELHKIYPV